MKCLDFYILRYIVCVAFDVEEGLGALVMEYWHVCMCVCVVVLYV